MIANENHKNIDDKQPLWLEKTMQLIGDEAIKKLKRSSVAIFGVGGVGSFAAEAIARCGVGKITLVDFDEINVTNINRQIMALNSTIGKDKVNVMSSRIKDINPNCAIRTHKVFVSNENIDELIPEETDFVIDAIDCVESKLDLIEHCFKKHIHLVSSMGTGNKLDPTKFLIDDISKTQNCPLAKAVRLGLRKRGIERGVDVVYSKEIPAKQNQRNPASISFVPSVAGLILAGHTIRKIIELPDVTVC